MKDERIQLTDGTANCSLAVSTYKKGKIFETHCHPSFEILLVLGGKITVLCENREYIVSAGQLATFAPFAYHTVFAATDGEYERINLYFDKADLPAPIATSFADTVKHAPVCATPAYLSFAHTVKKMLNAENREFYQPLFRAQLISLFYSLLEAETKLDAVEADNIDESVEKILTFVNENIEKKISLDEIAKAVFLSKSSVCHLFKQKMKISIKQYVLQKKMSYATLLLQKGTPAGEVSKQIGYQNYANFYTIYKSITGHTPVESKNKENGF